MNIVNYYLGMSWRLLSPWGNRSDPFTGNTTFHYGIDFGIPLADRSSGNHNIPVLTPFTGPVHSTGVFGGRGITVVQRVEGTDILAVFQHLHRATVKKGQTLKPDDSVGLCGSTGRSTGVHLHFELRKYSSSALGSGVWGNPALFKIPQYDGGDKMETVVLDPGHGGDGRYTKYGAVGNGIREKEVVLDIARFCRKRLLDDYICKVVMTRDSDVDVPFEERAAIARRANASLLHSFHMNGFGDPSANGFETFIFNGTLQPSTIQNQHTIHNTIYSYLNDLGIRDRGKKRANFAILRLPPTSCVLTEYVFITNPREAEIIKRPGMLKNLGDVTAEAIAEALDLEKKVKPPVEPPSQPDELPDVQRKIGIMIGNEMTDIPAYLLNGSTFGQVHPILKELGYKVTPHGTYIKIWK